MVCHLWKIWRGIFTPWCEVGLIRKNQFDEMSEFRKILQGTSLHSQNRWKISPAKILPRKL